MQDSVSALKHKILKSKLAKQETLYEQAAFFHTFFKKRSSFAHIVSSELSRAKREALNYS